MTALVTLTPALASADLRRSRAAASAASPRNALTCALAADRPDTDLDDLETHGAAAVTGQQHDYQSCDDPEYPRFGCKVYKGGYAEAPAPGSPRATRPGTATATPRATPRPRPTAGDRR